MYIGIGSFSSNITKKYNTFLKFTLRAKVHSSWFVYVNNSLEYVERIWLGNTLEIWFVLLGDSNGVLRIAMSKNAILFNKKKQRYERKTKIV